MILIWFEYHRHPTTREVKRYTNWEVKQIGICNQCYQNSLVLIQQIPPPGQNGSVRPPPSLLDPESRLASQGVGVGGHAVLGEHRLELLQGGIGPNPGRVKMSPAHSKPCLGQVLEELVQPRQSEKE